MPRCCSWVTPAPLPCPQSDVSASCSKSALLLVSWCSRKMELCCCQGLFFSTSIFREQADAVTHRGRASVREWVTAAGVWPPPTNEWHGKAESCSFTRGVVHTRRQSTPPSQLQKQVSVSRCRKWFFETRLLFFLYLQIQWTVRLALMLHIDAAVQPDHPSICCSVCCGIPLLLLWQHKSRD